MAEYIIIAILIIITIIEAVLIRILWRAYHEEFIEHSVLSDIFDRFFQFLIESYDPKNVKTAFINALKCAGNNNNATVVSNVDELIDEYCSHIKGENHGRENI